MNKYNELKAALDERDNLKAEVDRQAEEIVDLKDGNGGLRWAIGEMKGQHKNLHRSLCARFGYAHDEKYWWRDDVSLEEHIAKQIQDALAGQMILSSERDLLKSELESLKQDAARYRWLRQYDFDIGSYHPEGDFSHESWFERFDDQSIDRMIAEEIAFEEEVIIEANNK